MALVEMDFASGGGNEKIYVATASSNAEVKAWDVVTSFSNPNVNITLPFEPKYILTRCKYSSNSYTYWNVWDSSLSTSRYVQTTINAAYSAIASSSLVVSIPNSSSSWISNISGKNITLLNSDSLTLTDALFIAIG